MLRHPVISISITAPVWGGTFQWMAPELFDGESRPSKATDIYALGIVIYEVRRIAFFGEIVLKDRSRRSSHTNGHSPWFFYFFVPGLVGKRPSRPPNRDILGHSDDVWMLMERCWDQTPSARPHITVILTLIEAVSHGWTSPTSEASHQPKLSHDEISFYGVWGRI